MTPPPEPGHFDINSGVLTLPRGDTMRVVGGSLSVRLEAKAELRGWNARLRIVPGDTVNRLIHAAEPLHAYLVGVAFSWSGKALVSYFRPAEDEVELTGTGVLTRNTIEST